MKYTSIFSPETRAALRGIDSMHKTSEPRTELGVLPEGYKQVTLRNGAIVFENERGYAALQCVTCLRWMDPRHFAFNGRNPGGHANSCKACGSDRRKPRAAVPAILRERDPSAELPDLLKDELPTGDDWPE